MKDRSGLIQLGMIVKHKINNRKMIVVRFAFFSNMVLCRECREGIFQNFFTEHWLYPHEIEIIGDVRPK